MVILYLSMPKRAKEKDLEHVYYKIMLQKNKIQLLILTNASSLTDT